HYTHNTIKPHIIAALLANPGLTIKQLERHFKGWTDELAINNEEILESIFFMIYFNEFRFDYEELITTSSKIYLRTDENKVESLETWLKRPNWLSEKPTTIESVSLVDLHSYSKKQLETAEKRLEIIKPLINNATEKKVVQVASQNNVGRATIWRWLKRYNEEKDFRALISSNSQSGLKKAKFNEELLKHGVESYLKLEKPTIKRAYEIMQSKALTLNKLNETPSYQTFRRRLNLLEEKEVVKKRLGTRRKNQLFTQAFESFPHDNWSLQTVQIDHTPIDVLVVDEQERLVTEKPYITVAIDIHSRVVLGYALTFDSPSRLSIAMTLMNCVQNKSSTLKKVREVFSEVDEKYLRIIENCEWKDVYGLPATLHMDNGSDFRSKDIINFGRAYNIKLQYRPVGGSRFGAHVERFLGTLNKRLHSIKGSTFSNIKERGDYNSEKKASFTFNELEAIIISELVYYHMDFHQGIKTTPIAKWKESFTSKNPLISHGRNLPKNMDMFKFDILPSEKRTIQREGISLYGIYYNSEKLRRWIRSKEPTDPHKSRKFIIRYDPRDLRKIYFYDPEVQKYYTIRSNEPFLLRLFQDKPLSLWEWKSVNKEITTLGYQQVKTKQKLQLISVQQDMEEIAVKKKKSQRQLTTRRKRRVEQQKEEKRDSQEILVEDNLEYFDDDMEIIPYESDGVKIKKNYMGSWNFEEED
ncbi:MAG: hypothetical protein HeimC2_30260, partial [Candidatus Heimdallarchaeota archaeon LC_2]